MVAKIHWLEVLKNLFHFLLDQQPSELCLRVRVALVLVIVFTCILIYGCSLIYMTFEVPVFEVRELMVFP